MSTDISKKTNKSHTPWRFERDKYAWKWEGKQEPQRVLLVRRSSMSQCFPFLFFFNLTHLLLFPLDYILDCRSPWHISMAMLDHYYLSRLHHYQTGIRFSDEIWGTGIKEMRSGRRTEGQIIRCWINLLTYSKYSKCQWRRRERKLINGVAFHTSVHITNTHWEFQTIYYHIQLNGEGFMEDMNMWESIERRIIQWIAGM